MENENRYEGCAPAATVIAVLAMLLLLICCGCRTRYVTNTEYREVPVVMRDTTEKAVWRIDTTIVRDSVFFAVKGDTVIKERYSTRWRIKVAHDTAISVVEKPVEIIRTQTKTEQVEVNRLYWWQKALMWVGGVTVLYVCGMLIKSVRKLSVK